MTVIDDMINKSYPSVAQSFVLTGIMMAAMLIMMRRRANAWKTGMATTVVMTTMLLITLVAGEGE